MRVRSQHKAQKYAVLPVLRIVGSQFGARVLADVWGCSSTCCAVPTGCVVDAGHQDKPVASERGGDPGLHLAILNEAPFDCGRSVFACRGAGDACSLLNPLRSGHPRSRSEDSHAPCVWYGGVDSR